MNEKLQPTTEASTALDKGLMGVWFVWLGLVLGTIIIAAVLIGVVFVGELPDAGLGDLAYLFLIPVPLSLVAAYVLVPMFSSKNPVALVQSASAQVNKPDPAWQQCTPEDPYYWFPAFCAQWFVRIGLLEGPNMILLVGFVATTNWVLLAGTVPLFAAMLVEAPTRIRYTNWMEAARSRTYSEE